MLSEHDIDRELKAALSVSPAAGFEARVLQRVEEDRPPSWAARYGWLAAAASLVIAAGVFYALTRTSPALPPAPQVVEQAAPRAPSAQPDMPVPVEAPARASTPTSDAPRVVVVRAASRAPRSAEPEVLVPVNQMEAVRRLVRAVNEGRVEAPAEPPPGPMETPAELQVAPVEIKPIPLSPVEPRMESATPFIRVVK